MSRIMRSSQYLLPFAITAILIGILSHNSVAKASPLTQEVGIKAVNCTYTLVGQPGGDEPFEPSSHLIIPIPQQTEVEARCSVEATIPEDSKLRIRSDLDSWSGNVNSTVDGQEANRTRIEGPEDIIPIVGGTFHVNIEEGTTPRVSQPYQDENDESYEGEVYAERQINLIEIQILPPNSSAEPVVSQPVKTASIIYIRAKESIEKAKIDSPGRVVDTAESLLNAGFPVFSMNVLGLKDEQAHLNGIIKVLQEEDIPALQGAITDLQDQVAADQREIDRLAGETETLQGEIDGLGQEIIGVQRRSAWWGRFVGGIVGLILGVIAAVAFWIYWNNKSDPYAIDPERTTLKEEFEGEPERIGRIGPLTNPTASDAEQ